MAKRMTKPIEPHYQPPHQQLYQLVSQRRQHTPLPSIAEANTEPPNIEKLRLTEDSQVPMEDSIPVDTMIPDSQSVSVKDSLKASYYKLLNDEPLKEIGNMNQGLRSNLTRPTLSSTRRRSESRVSQTVIPPSRKPRDRSIFDIEEDGTDPVLVDDTIQVPSTPRLLPFTPINQKRKHISTLEEAEEGVDAEQTPFRKEPLDDPPAFRKRTKRAFDDGAQNGRPDHTDTMSRYWSSVRESADVIVRMPQGTSSQDQIQQPSEQDSTLIVPPPGFPSSSHIRAPKATENEGSSDLLEIPFSMKSPDRFRKREERRASSFVDSQEAELHERAARKTRAFRTAKAYGLDVAEMRDKQAGRSQKVQSAASGDLIDSIRTAY